MPGQIIPNNPSGWTTTMENGHPECFQPDMPPDQTSGYNWLPDRERNLALLDDRRVLPIALLNCNALEASGEKNNGQFEFDVPELAYVFITEPMEQVGGPDTKLYIEMLGTLDAESLK